MTLFLVEQNARHALNPSDRAYVMVNGQIRLSGKRPDAAQRPGGVQGISGDLAEGGYSRSSLRAL